MRPRPAFRRRRRSWSNERWREGMLTSVWAGLDAAEALAADAVLVHPVDNPLVAPATIDAGRGRSGERRRDRRSQPRGPPRPPRRLRALVLAGPARGAARRRRPVGARGAPGPRRPRPGGARLPRRHRHPAGRSPRPGRRLPVGGETRSRMVCLSSPRSEVGGRGASMSSSQGNPSRTSARAAALAFLVAGRDPLHPGSRPPPGLREASQRLRLPGDLPDDAWVCRVRRDPHPLLAPSWPTRRRPRSCAHPSSCCPSSWPRAFCRSSGGTLSP